MPTQKIVLETKTVELAIEVTGFGTDNTGVVELYIVRDGKHRDTIPVKSGPLCDKLKAFLLSIVDVSDIESVASVARGEKKAVDPVGDTAELEVIKP